LALNQYQFTHGVLPASYLPELGHSYDSLILPELDQQILYNRYNFSQPSWAEANRKIVDTRLIVMICPESSTQGHIPAGDVLTGWRLGLPGTSEFGPSHYAVNWGGGRGEWGHDFVLRRGRNRGVSMEGRGVSAKEVTDGLATTILAGEKPSPRGWAIGGWAASEFDVGLGPVYSGNSRVGGLVHTGSDHRDGANFTMCDGSIRRFTSRMNQDIWYSLITRNGGELVSDDFEP
jgi:prepilin-type processing-associated H-X9-DG protein